jgi:hypothetical protein
MRLRRGLPTLLGVAVCGLLFAWPATARTIRLGWVFVNGADPFSWTTQREFRL